MNEEKIIDGKLIASQIKAEIKTKISKIIAEKKRLPKLVVIQVGDESASDTYIRNKRIACDKVGIIFELKKLPAATSEHDLLLLIDELNCDCSIDGILVQLPLPATIDNNHVIDAISVSKDADGFSAHILGNMMINPTHLLPATPKGIMHMLSYKKIDLVGKHVVVINRSNIVGKPLANLLINAHATVSVCHSKTHNLPWFTRNADILIVAVGKPGFIKQNMIKPGVVVIDVGTSRVDGKLQGDVDFLDVIDKVKYITPVPGGVGPMTIASLLENVMHLYDEHQTKNII